jgi:hypothetical protein
MSERPTWKKPRRKNPLISLRNFKLCWTFGALGEIRTPDPRNRNPMLYPAELRAHKAFQWVRSSAQLFGSGCQPNVQTSGSLGRI